LEISTPKASWYGRFASDEVLRKTKSNDVPIQVGGYADPKPLLAEAGMHRFVWDLHYALPKRSQILLGAGRAYGGAGQTHREAHRDGKSSTQPLNN